MVLSWSFIFGRDLRVGYFLFSEGKVIFLIQFLLGVEISTLFLQLWFAGRIERLQNVCAYVGWLFSKL
jgi:hypothetical protein